MPVITDEQYQAFQDFMQRFAPKPRREGPDPAHRGVIDPDYVRPAPHEFPKMVYHLSGMTKIVQSRKEQNELGDAWSEQPTMRPTDWKAKLTQVFTQSGFQVYKHHVEFLKLNDAPGVQTLQDAARFLDTLDAAQQEQFFIEAEEFQIPEEKSAKKK